MRVEEDISLKPYNTFGIEAKAQRMIVVQQGDDMYDEEYRASLVGHITEPYFILGAGSNVVFTRDYEGTIVHVESRNIRVMDYDGEKVLVEAEANALLDDVVAFCLARNLYGMENLSAIPGTVGAAAVQNAGAYGVELKDVLHSVMTIDLATGEEANFMQSECQFGYRDSIFKHCNGRYLIHSVVLELNTIFYPNLSYKALQDADATTADALRKNIIDIRWAKLPKPEETGSAGSFFKNPVVSDEVYQNLVKQHPEMPPAHKDGGRWKLSAAWLIDHAGWKDKRHGGAGVWPKQALVLCNMGGCTGNDVKELAAEIQKDVKQKYGVTIAPEAIII